MREIEVVLDSGSVLLVRQEEDEVPDQAARAVLHTRRWWLDGDEIPEWAGVTLVQMMVLPGRRWPHGPTG